MQVNAPRLLRSACVSLFALVLVVGIVAFTAKAATYTAGITSAVNWTSTGVWGCAPTTAAGDTCGAFPGALALAGITDAANITSSGGGPLSVTSTVPQPVTLNLGGGTLDIAAGGQLTLTGASSEQFTSGTPTLSISGGKLLNGGTLSVATTSAGGIFTLNGGTLGGTGSTSIAAGSFFNLTGTSGAMAITQQTINTAGSSNFSSSSTLTMSSGATIVNSGSFTGNLSGTIAGGSTELFKNTGAGNVNSSGGALTFAVPFVNDATVATTSSGVTMNFTGGSGAGGHNAPAAWNFGTTGAAANFGGTHVFNGTETFSGSGMVTVNGGGTWMLNSAQTLGTGLNLTNNGNMTFGGPAEALLIAGGNYGQTGTFTPRLGVGGTAAGGADSVTVVGSATLGGTLSPVLAPGYTPAAGDTFTVMTFTSSTGAFTYTPLTFPGGEFVMTNTGTSIVLAAVATADLAAAKTGPASVNDGATASYTVTITNLDTVNTATGITFTDTFSSGTIATPPAGCTGPAAGPLTCSIASLAPLANRVFTFNVLTNTPGVLTNTAQITASTPTDPNLANNTATFTTTVNPAADLQVSNPFTVSPATVNAAAPVTFTATLTNNGPDPATSPQFNFTLSGGGTITSGTAGGGFTCLNFATTLSCSAATLPVATPVTFTITVTAPNQAGTITLSGNASSTTTDPNAANNSGSGSAAVAAITDLAILKTVSGPVVAGQNVLFNFTVKNLGPSDASNVVISDTPGPGLTFVSTTVSCGVFPCTIGTFTAGSVLNFTATYALASSATGTMTNVASVTTTTTDSNPGNNTTTASSPITTSADLVVSKSGPASVTPGGTVTYAVTVTNNGPSDAGTTTVSDPTPANLTFVSATGACTSFPCTLPSLAAGGSATINATYTVAAGATGSITNAATASSSTPDPSSANNTGQATSGVTPVADLSISKSAPVAVFAGANVGFSIVVTNLGPAAASNVVINDTPSAGLTFVSASGACTSFPCTIATLANGANVSISATYKVASNATSVTNTADVTSPTLDMNSTNNSAVVTRSVTSTCPTVPIMVNPADGQTNVPVTGTIQWTGAGGNPSYDVYLGPAGTGCATLVGSTSSTSFPYSGLTPDTDYESRIVAKSGACAPQASTCIRFHTAAAACNVGVPSLVAPVNGVVVASPVTLQWTAVNGADSYHVVVAVNGVPTVDTTTTATSLNVALGNGAMQWSVAAIAGNCSGTAATGNFGVCSPPAAPRAGVVGAPSSGHAYQVIVTNPQPDTTQYDYQEATNDQFTDAVTQTTSAPTVTYQHDTGASASLFFYRVRAYNSCTGGPGAFSKTIRVVIVPATVTTRPVLNVPAGTKGLVVEQIFIPGLNEPASFTATADKPWVVKIVPSFGTLTPAGETLNVYIDPTQLPNGTFTATIIVTTTPLTTGRLTTNGNTTTTAPISINLVTPVVPVDPSAPAADSLIIPAVGHLTGINSQWRSDIRVFNASLQNMSYLLSFVSNTSTDVKQTTINTAPGDTTALDDIIHNWYGFGEVGDNASGVLEITPLTGDNSTPNPLDTIVSSRTYNLSNFGGTLGQFIPAVPLAQFVGSGDPHLSLQQISQSQQFRTNFGLVEASGQPVNVLLSMFQSDGTKLFDLPVVLSAFQQMQLNGLLAQQGITDLADGRMEVQVSGGGGKVTAYASVVDNASQDPLFVPGKPLANAAKNLYVMPGVADLNNSTASWRTDMRIFNSSTAPQSATLTFFPEGQGTPLNATVTINPGEVKVLDNILQSTFAAQNVGGAVHIATANASQLVVTGRTYNQTAAGTLGQFIPAATLDQAMSAGSRGLNILQVEDSMRSRANVGLAEMSGQAATVEIGVVLPDSKVTPTIQLPLGPNEFKQFPLSAFGLGDVYNVRVTMRVIDGGGHVTAYGSIIDETTQAPTYVAAQ